MLLHLMNNEVEQLVQCITKFNVEDGCRATNAKNIFAVELFEPNELINVYLVILLLCNGHR